MKKNRPSKKICVVGAGNWGKNHVRTLSELGLLGGIVDSDKERLKKLAREYPGVPTFAQLKDAAAKGFAGFTVATPAATHFEVAKFLIEAGHPVLVEKPMALTVRDAEELVRLARERGLNLMTGHVLLFHPAIQKIKAWIDQGKIGKLEYLYSNRLNLGAVRQEENALWSFAPHDISIFQYLIGEMPVRVQASGGAFLQPHIHDVTVTTLAYPKNIVGHIFVSWLHPFKEHRLVIIGSKGMLVYEDSSQEKNLLFYEKGIDWLRGEPVKRDGATEIIPYEKAAPLAEELRYFAQSLGGKKIGIASGESAVDVLRILEQATGQLVQPGTQEENRRAAAVKEKPYFAHKTAHVDEPCEIGEGTKIWHFAHIMKDARIGKDCNLGQNVFVASGVRIGNNVKIQNNVSLYTGAVIEDDVFLGPSCVFTNVINPRSEIIRHHEYKKTVLRRGSTVGANATIVCGVEIGRYAFIAAGATVTKDVPDYALMMGTPARQAGWMSRHGARLPLPNAKGIMICPESGLRYKEARRGVLRCLDLPEDKPLQPKKKQ